MEAKRHPKFCFDNTLIAIQIEDTLFNVHKYQLMKSTTFSDMFAVAEQADDEEKTKEGLSLDNPIVMREVSAADFECLMTVLYASHFSSQQPEPEASLIIPAFRLASMWNFSELCSYLMPLAERVLSDVDKIVFAREFNTKDWLTPAYTNLCQRKERLTTEEARKIGVEGLLFISRFREDKLVLPKDVKAKCTGCSKDLRCKECSAAVQTISPPQDENAAGEKVKAWVDGGCNITEQ